MIPDLSVTIGGTARAVPRVSSESFSGLFSNPDGSIKMKVSHLLQKNRRSMFRIDQFKYAADPASTIYGLNYIPATQSLWWGLVTPRNGAFTPTETQDLITGFTSMMAASSNALTARFIGGES